MRRLIAVSTVLLALAAPLAAGGLPPSIAQLEDNGGELAAFQRHIQLTLVSLGELLGEPPLKYLDQLQQKKGRWTDLAFAQGNEFPGLGERVVAAYGLAHRDKKYKTMADLPGAYKTAIDEWQRKWDWFGEAGAQAFERIKWLELHTKHNENVNTPLGKQNWFWFQQTSGILESALYGANEEIKRRDPAMFRRRINMAKDAKRVIPLLKQVFKQAKPSSEKYFRDTKPEKKGQFLVWFKGVEDERDAWPSMTELKAAMLLAVTAHFGKYQKSYQEMVKMWRPVLDEKFLSVRREFTKDFTMRSLDRDYRFAIDALERKMTATLKSR